MNKRITAIWISSLVFLLTASFVITDKSFLSEKSDSDTGEFSKNDELGELTVEIASLSTQYRNKNFSDREQIKDSISVLAEKRYEKLSRLIEKDPAQILRFALPEDVLNNLPEDVQEYFEKREEIEGELEVVAACEETDGRILYFVKTDKEYLPLYFAKQPDEELMTGSRVRFNGIRIGDAVVADENRSNNESKDFLVTESVLPNTTGEQKVLVLLVNFQNDTRESYTVAQTNNVMFNTANTSSVTNYFREVSYGQTWITGDTFGYFTLPMNSGDCNSQYTIANLAKQAATNSGINISAYNKYMFVYPKMACSYTGWGDIGGSHSWINGSLGLRIPAHELGHNLGLNHSKAMKCGIEVLGSSCTTIEYGHPVDIIGSSSATGHFHPYQKERLGWLNYGGSPPITTVQSGGNYLISANSVADTNPKALKILKSVDAQGRKTWYYIEFRRAVGFDSFISGNSNLTNGVLVTMNNEVWSSENYVLDMTPATAGFTDAALTVNRSYTDSSNGMTITPLSVSSSGAMVNVSFGEVPCNLANPTISVTPSATQWIGQGSSVSYTVEVTNNNGSNCAANSFYIQPTLPSGWNAVIASPLLNVAPGSRATTTVQVNSPIGAADGFYSVGINAGNYNSPSYSTSTSVSLAVYSSLGVSASPGQASYTKTQTASVTAVVSTNGSPMTGVAVTFIMTKPNGKEVTSSATSNAQGLAVFSYKFNKKQDPTGTYLVNVNASMNGVSGSGSTSFEVR